MTLKTEIMKTYLDCIPCFMNQALKVSRLATNDEKVHRQMLDFSGKHLSSISLEKTPAENGAEIYKQIRYITGVYDPYREIKDRSIKEAKEIYPRAKEIINNSENKLLTAVKIAIAGNVIDFGMNNKFSIKDDLEHIIHQNFAFNDFSTFEKEILKAKNILYIGDNAGESVFDKLLIEQINKPTIFATREFPVINDLVIEDAINSGLNEVAEIISSGSPAPGAILHLCNKEFMEIYNSADVVISKGQGNYEALSDEKRKIFFMLKAKCSVIAEEIGVKINDIVLKGINF